MSAALEVCARRGLQQASIDDIAQQAGFTKGAFYANFASKDDLFLAMLDEHFAERIAEIEDATGTEDGAQTAADAFTRFIRANPEWNRLFFEFVTHAARDEEFRAELLVRYGLLRAAIADAIRAEATALGIEPPGDPEQIAVMIFAAGNGAGIELLLRPDDTPDELFATMLGRLTAP